MFEQLVSEPPSSQALLSAVALTIFLLVVVSRSFTKSYKDIPTIGAPNFWGIPTTESLMACRKLMLEGYARYPDGFFKMPLFPFGYVVIANARPLMEELCNAPDDKFSFAVATGKLVQTNYNIGREILNNRFHVPIIRTVLTRNIGPLFDDLREEMILAFKASGLHDKTKMDKNGWASVPALSTFQYIIARTTNRIFIGAPVCQDEEYCMLNTMYTVDVVNAANKINMFPNILHPIVGPYFSPRRSYVKRMLRIIGPTIKERRRLLKEEGEAALPNDYLTWNLLDAPEGWERSDEGLAMRMLNVNLGSINTSSVTFTHALYHLAAEPEFIAPLREEVERCTAGGWNKASIANMKRLDSFLRESGRLNAISLTSLNRTALQDYTFKEGTFIPKGTTIAASMYSTHMDESIYKNASTFDPWRFVDLSAQETKSQWVGTSTEFLSFGAGKHVCPGRFFAANELKAMLAYILVTYDIKLASDANGVRPDNEYIGTSVIPNTKAHLLFKVRGLST